MVNAYYMLATELVFSLEVISYTKMAALKAIKTEFNIEHALEQKTKEKMQPNVFGVVLCRLDKNI